MRVTHIRAVVEEALARSGSSARAASTAAGSPYIIRDLRRGHLPSCERVAALCDALDLEFYVGPRRALKSTFSAAKVNFARPACHTVAVPDGELAALLAAICDHWESLNDYGRRDFAANVLGASAGLRARHREHEEGRGTRRKGGSE